MKRLCSLAFVGLAFVLAACGGGGSSSQPGLVPPANLTNVSVEPTPRPAPYYTMYLAGDLAPGQSGQVQEFSTQQLNTGDGPTNPWVAFTDGAGDTQVTALTVGPAFTTYVAYARPNAHIAVYDSAARGTTNPARTIDGPWAKIYSLAMGPSNTLYVLAAPGGCSTPTEILEYSYDASGNAQPLRTIAGSNTGLGQGQGVITVGYDGTVFFADETHNKVLSYGPDASGNVAPATTLAGSATLLNSPSAVAVTPTGSLAVWNYTSQTATEYPPGASGNTAPATTWSSPSSGDQARLMAVDTAGYFFVYMHVPNSSGGMAHRIAVFPPNASGGNISWTYILSPANPGESFTVQALTVQ